MVEKELYFKTVGILSDAERNKMLRYRSLTHCAVANLIVANMGYRSTDCFILGDWYFENIEVDHRYWHYLLHYHNNPEAKAKLLQHIGMDGLKFAERQLRSTGYSFEELLKIEEAFENGKVDNETPDYKRGLSAVLNVLKEIHQVTAEDQEMQISLSRNFNGVRVLVKMFFSKCLCYVTEVRSRLKAIIKQPLYFHFATKSLITTNKNILIE